MKTISPREQITDLIIDYINTQNEWQAHFWTDNVEAWDGKRLALYGNGVVLGKFREKDLLTMQTLKRGVTDSAHKEEILDSCRNEVKELECVEDPTFMHIVSLDRSKKRIAALVADSVDMWILKNCEWANGEKEQVRIDWTIFGKSFQLSYL